MRFRIQYVPVRRPGFHDGIAAVRDYGGWGFIDKDGDIVVPCEYDEFEASFAAGKGKLIKNGSVFVFDKNGNILTSYDYEDKQHDENDDDYDDYTPRYDKYGGHNGYDDQTIDEAFGGDPSATWNID